MFKAYIHRWKHREKPEEHVIDYWFCSDAANAAFWGTREDAQNDGVIFEHNGIVIHSPHGIRHVCSGFKIEQRAPTEFVIFYEVPFIPADATPERRKADTMERKAKLEKYIKDNPNSSTLEKEQLEEITKQERKEQSDSGEVLY